LRAVVLPGPGGLITLRTALAVVTVAAVLFGLRPGALSAAASRPGSSRRPPRAAAARVPPARIFGVPAASAALDRLLLAVVTPSEPDAQKDGNENHDDNGCEADHQQDLHCTTQQGMAIW
jgi:hypothetical protein